MTLQSFKVKRNEPCPCGSGKKTKKCCLRAIKDLQKSLTDGVDPMTAVVQRILTGAPSEPETQPDPKARLSPS
jgi:hypothetical protein